MMTAVTFRYVSYFLDGAIVVGKARLGVDAPPNSQPSVRQREEKTTFRPSSQPIFYRGQAAIKMP